jgi:head-tail adaptor
MADEFDEMLISTCTISRRAAGDDRYGQKNGAFAPVTVDWPCRVSTSSGGREQQTEKKNAFDTVVVFMRPTDITEKDQVTVDGYPLMNVVGIRNPSSMNHHYEVKCELVLP